MAVSWVISKLASCNWYTQNPAATALGSVDWKDTEKDEKHLFYMPGRARDVLVDITNTDEADNKSTVQSISIEGQDVFDAADGETLVSNAEMPFHTILKTFRPKVEQASRLFSLSRKQAGRLRYFLNLYLLVFGIGITIRRLSRSLNPALHLQWPHRRGASS